MTAPTQQWCGLCSEYTDHDTSHHGTEGFKRGDLVSPLVQAAGSIPRTGRIEEVRGKRARVAWRGNRGKTETEWMDLDAIKPVFEPEDVRAVPVVHEGQHRGRQWQGPHALEPGPRGPGESGGSQPATARLSRLRPSSVRGQPGDSADQIRRARMIDPMNIINPAELTAAQRQGQREADAELALLAEEARQQDKRSALEQSAKEHDDWERALRAKEHRDELRESLALSQSRHADLAKQALRRH